MNDSPKTASIWAPLQQPLYRSLWIASVVSNIGTWMEDVGEAWLMTAQTSSPLYVALLQTAESLPIFLLALPAGALADVVDRRRLLLFTQGWMCLAATCLGVLTLMGLTTPLVLLALTSLIGIATALNVPAWQAIIPELVTRGELPAATALGGVGFNVARSIGPALGGVLVATMGPGAVFLLNGASFIAVIAALYHWKRQPAQSISPAERLFGAMRAGVRYTRHAPVFRAVLVRTLAFTFFGSALWALLPVVARHELGLSAIGYGALLACLGVGAISGAILLPRVRDKVPVEAMTVTASLVWAAVIVAAAFLRVTALLYVLMLAAGVAWISLISSFNIGAQIAVPSWVRGRAMAVYMLVFQGGMAAGSMAWGAIADREGVATALAAAAAGLVAGLLTALRYRLPLDQRMDLTPSLHWPTPALVLAPHEQDGPVLVQVEYQVDPEQAADFRAAMRAAEPIRRRDGAFQWGLFRDLESPERWVETFLVDSWGEHLRQHERHTLDDRKVEEQVRSFHTGEGPPAVSHLIWGAAAYQKLAHTHDHSD